MSLKTRTISTLIGDKGNTKIPPSTLIFNITAALDCPSDDLGLCNISKDCYAKKAEIQYKSCLRFRREQAELWSIIAENGEYTVYDLADTVYNIASRRRKNKVQYLRFNESGDVRDQNDIDTIIKFAKILKDMSKEKPEFDLVTVYLYTKRKDLDWKEAMEVNNLVINGSGFMLDNNFDIIEKHTTPNAKQLIGKGKWLCNGDCSLCNACMVKGKREINIFKH